jgi:hypothetical protein
MLSADMCRQFRRRCSFNGSQSIAVVQCIYPAVECPRLRRFAPGKCALCQRAVKKQIDFVPPIAEHAPISIGARQNPLPIRLLALRSEHGVDRGCEAMTKCPVAIAFEANSVNVVNVTCQKKEIGRQCERL